MHIFEEHNIDADAGRGVRCRSDEREDHSKVVWPKVTGFRVRGFWDGSCRDDVCGAFVLINIFAHTFGWYTLFNKYGPVRGKKSFDAEIAGCSKWTVCLNKMRG